VTALCTADHALVQPAHRFAPVFGSCDVLGTAAVFCVKPVNHYASSLRCFLFGPPMVGLESGSTSLLPSSAESSSVRPRLLVERMRFLVTALAESATEERAVLAEPQLLLLLRRRRE